MFILLLRETILAYASTIHDESLRLGKHCLAALYGYLACSIRCSWIGVC